jgi:hypothetical protein
MKIGMPKDGELLNQHFGQSGELVDKNVNCEHHGDHQH